MSDALPPIPGASDVEAALLRYAIPAARAAGIQIVRLNWGLTEEDLEKMPPGPLRGFGWRANHGSVDYGITHGDSGFRGGFSTCGESKSHLALGADLGTVTDGDREVQAGRALMRDTWNAALRAPLLAAYPDGQRANIRPDVLLHKNNSGMWSEEHGCTGFLREHGIRTLLFTGLNTDQCVMATLLDAQARGYDTIMLRYGCATNSPRYAQQNAEYNCCRNPGFLSTCQALAKAVGVNNEE